MSCACRLNLFANQQSSHCAVPEHCTACAPHTQPFSRSPRQKTHTSFQATVWRAGGAVAICSWGALGAAQAGLPITKGPQTGGENGKGGKSGRL